MTSSSSRPSDGHSRKDSISAPNSQNAGTDIESPNTPIKAPGPGFGSRRFSQSRSTTMPTLSNTMSSDANHRTIAGTVDGLSGKDATGTVQDQLQKILLNWIDSWDYVE